MKIGVITYHQALNYGATLQTYALQKYISRRHPNIDIEVINYKNVYLEKIKSYRNCMSKNVVASIFRVLNLVKKRYVFNRFYKKNIKLSDEYGKDNIKNVNNKYDIFITGSDQVWNPELNGNDNTYLLAFVYKKNIYSYAASFGLSDIPLNSRNAFYYYLNRFNILSVREKSGIGLLENLGISAPVRTDIDPTLLLERKEWDSLCNKMFIPKEYVLIYTIEYLPELVKVAQKYAREKGKKIYYVGPFCFEKGVKYIPAPSIEQLITLFRNADHTFVSSFHGAVFSIIYHKSFTAITPYSDGRNERVMNLLREFNLEYCLYNDKKRIIDVIDEWDRIENDLCRLRKKSENYIEDIINENRTN